MYGIDFIGHPSLRKLYLPADFEGNPLRKDFPLLARIVKPWPGLVDAHHHGPHRQDQPTVGAVLGHLAGLRSAQRPHERSRVTCRME